jgi:hypothetical protein
MRKVYGDKIRFVAFDVRQDDHWMSVARAEEFVKAFDQLEFVYYKLLPFDLKELGQDRDAPSVQATRNGIQEPQLREGIVIRPVEELFSSSGKRLIFKFTSDAFKEQLHKKPIVRDPAKQKLNKSKFNMLLL